ncbi:ATP-binding protein [Chromobacterium sp. IIBBL 290-4]|uniref:ATP-binding protein n=1 Tax=Chromobacterium sp. IIBBL 290-4 TaxID=2953890 RepID=UPI0020B73361|nr:ATP-binding protein [Chromobacterium sp. IIBBL 290-4]UTH73502.1 ATP-binding protein [Chromobacterium sp. IIBBL 290-4]
MRTSSPRSKLAGLLCWLLASGLLLAHSLLLDLRQQKQEFQQTADQLVQNADHRLRNSEMLQQEVGEIVSSASPARRERISALTASATETQPQLYFIGYQPLVSQAERAGFEAQQTKLLGKPFNIRDYLHDRSNSWRNPSAWRLAPVRPRYLPLSMAEPGLGSHDWREAGLDMLDDNVLAASVNKALGNLQATSPILTLHNGEPGFALFRTIYQTETPSPVPLVRMEQACGVVMQVLYLKPLLALPPSQSTRYSLQLISRDAGAETPQSLASQSLEETESWLPEVLPELSFHAALPRATLPYELVLKRQLQFERTTLIELLLIGTYALLPAYLCWALLAMLEHTHQTRKKTEEDIFREREYATVALRSIGDAVISIDTHRIIQYLNPAAEALLSLPAVQALQRRLQQVAPLHYEFSRHPASDPVEEAERSRQEVYLAQNCYLKRNSGEKILIEGSVAPLLGRNGQLTGFVLTFRDTAPIRRRMLAALEASETRLRQHEMELARVARINTMGEMASGIAHEINQPLSAIMSYCQAGLSLLDEDELDTAMLRRALTSSVNQADRAGRIIHRLRDFVTRKNHQLSAVQLNQTVHNALSLLDYELQDHEIHIEQNFAPELPLVYADTIQLEQVVLNLARNAVEAMEQTRPWGRLNLTTRQQGDRVQLIISDNGSGIPPDKLDRIFDPFFSTKPNGMGLGLAICQTAVEAFGGRLTAGNKPGSGAEFIIDLPCVPRAVAQPSGAEA